MATDTLHAVTVARDLATAIRNVPLRTLLRETARRPLELEAAQTINSLRQVQLVELTGPISFNASVSELSSRHAWSLHASDQLVLQSIIVGRGARTAFEFGTFNGGTTRLLAESLPPDGRVVTLDLPPAAFDASQRPAGFRGSDVGVAYRDSPSVHKIEQLLHDSLTFDATELAGQFDIVLVDGGHDFDHGLADAANALTLVAPGGVILFDDFVPYWHGLIRGITAALDDRNLARLAGTSLGVYIPPVESR